MLASIFYNDSTEIGDFCHISSSSCGVPGFLKYFQVSTGTNYFMTPTTCPGYSECGMVLGNPNNSVCQLNSSNQCNDASHKYMDSFSKLCYQCQDKCLTCSSYSVCISCPNGSYLYQNDCLEICPVTFFGNMSNICQCKLFEFLC